MNERKLINANDLRGALLATIEGVLEGRISVPMANSVVGLSGELHKSIRQEWDMRVYANEHLSLEAGKVIKLIGAERCLCEKNYSRRQKGAISCS